MASRSGIKLEDHLQSNASSNQSGSNDFVKKLFQMLQEDSYKNIVRWTKGGDSFVVINTNEFTKEILPRHFKHSNFASFVRQLNKYDFHKVKIPNEAKQNYEYGEDAWEFRHPEFRINDRDALDNIKRKGPSTKKSSDGVASLSSYASSANPQVLAQINSLQDSVESLKSKNKSLRQELNVMQTKYKSVVETIAATKNFNERYYRTLGVLANCLSQAGIKLPPLDLPSPPPMLTHQNLAQHDVNNGSSYIEASTAQTQAPARVARGGLQASPEQPPIAQMNVNMSAVGEAQASPQQGFSPQLNQLPNGSKESSTSGQVTATTPVVANNSISGGSPNGRDVPQVMTTNIPNPKFHVLLVEDDNVCIQLCRKFLVKYGCQVTVVTDGLNAISTVETTKYDLVLMDIVMPNLDGATATSVIRSFDTKTPIIAMTGNIEDNDLVTYLHNGMSDILAKPFTKDDLYSILSKHLLGDGGFGVVDPSPNQPPPTEPVLIMNGSNEPLGDPMLKKQRLQ